MYLKSIEIHGFKSFANKMVFEFNDGITAIVGPNGSGKSNVSDAVRWVLGEQSAKQLRGSKMEDIIFAGTEARRPLGFAYVAITLDNSDHKLPSSYEEITVARRVFRSGESEYLMNGTACRLKDVQELFMDTGIGKEGYSIIGQGQIDQILSGRPEDRRELFDEAAGIVKYKRRKSLTEKNLEAERANLCRINDIIVEIEKQAEPLGRQAETAKEYLRYRDELKVLDVDLFFKEYNHLKDSIKEVEEKDKIASDDLEDAKKSLEIMRGEYEELEKDIQFRTEKLEEKKSSLSNGKIERGQLEGEIQVLKEQINAIVQSENYYKERKEKLAGQISEKEKEKEKNAEKLQEIQHAVVEKKESFSSEQFTLLENSKKMDETSRLAEEYKKKLFKLVNEEAAAKSKLQHFETMLSQCNLKRMELNQRLLKVKSNESIFDETIEKETEALNKMNDQILGYQNVNDDIQAKMIDYDNKILAAKTKLRDISQTVNMERARLSSLKNMTERYDGYGQSIKRVMEQKGNIKGIVGVVADIVKVKKEYETAIEIALGGSIQNIVTEDEHIAKQLIQFLKTSKYGRATFLPLTLMSAQSNFNYPNALREDGIIGLASELVTADSRYQKIVTHLLGRVVVANYIDDAIRVSKKYHNALRIVTLEGDLVNPGGAMSGGAFKNASSLLSRRREIEEIEAVLASNQKKQQAMEEKIAGLRQEKEERQQKYVKNTERLHQLGLAQNTARLRLEQAAASKKDLFHEYQSIQKENMELGEQKESWESAMGEIQQKVEASESLKQDYEEKTAGLQAKLEELRKQDAALRDRVSSFQMDVSTMEQKTGFCRETIHRIKREIESLKEEQASLKETETNSKEQIARKKEEIETVKQKIQRKEEEALKLAGEIEHLEKERLEISQTHKEIFSKRDQLSERMVLLEKEHARLSSQTDRFHEQMDNLKNYMWEEYELTFNSAFSLKTGTEASIQQLKNAIMDVKTKIRGLGEVNVNAIEDYKNLAERYELMKTQHQDLVESEAALAEIIKELDEEMRKQFKEKFHEIEAEFDKAFKELFGGGKGSLELMEDADILEAGIKIVAQPPGKKLQNMMQLSGGEKALTAIALLFAIQNLKPSPFCLLDEIEAALDDSNVSRFANYLHNLTDHTQFIVITHRRGTMNAADVLYGITMQEKGISTLVSVNLIENELDK
ncbi:chromosome segregation protein SMC [[Clostridium] polysaccharolyticum]|uniref:Chromosome partition protein Smc n=1 Tax=[Clostridium] polysaccharolyticum TaxID=29364 RepID=A0A1I0AC52_9FIRM|nr:chromosome segregation protein SMC [[Clostridium] polysaccharolyticum]SES91809.1 condensin subunit Smc [[Clostridium] polysaccharolyticum]